MQTKYVIKLHMQFSAPIITPKIVYVVFFNVWLSVFGMHLISKLEVKYSWSPDPDLTLATLRTHLVGNLDKAVVSSDRS